MPYIKRDSKKNIIGVFACEQYKGQEYIKELPESYYTKQDEIKRLKQLCMKLNNSDWLIRRHHDQIELKIKASLLESKYRDLLKQRQEWRDEINIIDTKIKKSMGVK